MPGTRLLDVGNCDFDHGKMRAMLEGSFDVEIERVMFVPEAIELLRRTHYDLVLVNRRIFADDSDGGALIRHMKTDPEMSGIPVMLVSNFPEAQERAVADGARRGFGKAALDEHLANQILLYLALANGGAYTAQSLSLHTKTNIEVIKRFLHLGIEMKKKDDRCFEISVSPLAG